MRYMMFMIPSVYQPGTPESEGVGPGFAPPADGVEAMTRFNEELAASGALLAAEGLHPPHDGARIAFSGKEPVVTDGPFSEAKEVVGGYWIIDVPSREEAVAWARKCPAGEGDVIEIRRIFEMEDFPEDVREAADSPAVRARTEAGSR